MELLGQTSSTEIHQLSEKIIQVTRLPIEFLDEVQYKKDLDLFTEIVVRSGHYVGTLTDNRHFVFTLSPELQRWMNEVAFPKLIMAGIRYGAFVVSPDIFTQVSTQQVLEEDEAKAFTVRYFQTLDEAKAWLYKKVNT
jgi:hypothetical protein